MKHKIRIETSDLEAVLLKHGYKRHQGVAIVPVYVNHVNSGFVHRANKTKEIDHAHLAIQLEGVTHRVTTLEGLEAVIRKPIERE